jgi:hypothetical protein
MMCYGWHYGPHAAEAHQREFITLLVGSAAASAAQKSVHVPERIVRNPYAI